MNYDRWLTCYRDARDEAGTGYSSMAFSHGIDSDRRRHFQRFSGEPFSGEGAPAPLGMQPVSAESTIEFRPISRATYQEVTVDSTLTFKAVGTDLQYVSLRLPTGGAIRGTWELEALELSDGRRLSMAGLNADLYSTGAAARRSSSGQQDLEPTNQDMVTAMQGDQVISSNSSDLGMEMEAGSQDSEFSEISSQMDSAQAISAFPDGDPLLATRLPDTEQRLADSVRQVTYPTAFRYDVMAILPEPVAEGEQVDIRLKWKARWQFSNFQSTEVPTGAGMTTVVQSAGSTTGMNGYLPEVLPLGGGTRWDFTTKIGAPSRASLFRTQTLAASGDTRKEWQDEGLWNWLEVNGTSAVKPSVGIGGWLSYSDPPVQGFPGVRINVFPSSSRSADQFAPEVRRVLSFFKTFLPVYPQGEVDIFQGASETISVARLRSRPESRYGVVELRRVSVGAVGRSGEIRDENPHRAQSEIASQLASQYWGQLISPGSYRDQWLSQTISDAYAAFYIRAAFGGEDYEEWIQELRGRLEDPVEYTASWKRADALRRFYSQTGATPFTDIPLKARSEYGLYVFAEMLRLRLGNQAFFSSLDRLAEAQSDGLVTTDQVRQILEEVSGQDLSGFFDFWIHGGYIPSLKASVRTDDDGLFGCIESDIPFGHFDIPVRITSESGATDAFVEIRDGYGSFSITNAGEGTEIVLDPLGLSLSYSRETDRVKGQTRCPNDPIRLLGSNGE